MEASVQNAGGAVVPLTSAPVRPRLGPGRGRLEEPSTGKGLEAGSGGRTGYLDLEREGVLTRGKRLLRRWKKVDPGVKTPVERLH